MKFAPTASDLAAHLVCIHVDPVREDGVFCAISAAVEQHLHHGQAVPYPTPPQLTEGRSRACQRSCGAVHRRQAGGAPAVSGERHEEAARDYDQQEGAVFSSSRAPRDHGPHAFHAIEVAIAADRDRIAIGRNFTQLEASRPDSAPRPGEAPHGIITAWWDNCPPTT